jgi:hypothetical protein
MSFMPGAWRIISVESGTWHGVQIPFAGCRAIGFDQGPLASGEPFSQNPQGGSHFRIGIICRRRHQKIARRL